ncbi:MAG: prolyl-tRNA synthetase associated domain-containing protein [Lachnospiraceae bacterium]|nr:prolyl-tRNA synthetase associated domain-containing protein [Lachnospiraceae bacterium]
MELVKGRPLDETNRLTKEIETYDFLDSLGVEYDRIDHEAAFTMEVCEEIDKVLGGKTCKNLFLCNRQKTNYYLLLMPGDKPFKTKDLSAQIGSARLSFAGEQDMEQLLNLTPGSVTVLGLMYDKERRVKLLVDEEVLEDDFFGCHPCINTSSIKMKTSDVFEKILPALEQEFIKVSLPRYEA